MGYRRFHYRCPSCRFSWSVVKKVDWLGCSGDQPPDCGNGDCTRERIYPHKFTKATSKEYDPYGVRRFP